MSNKSCLFKILLVEKKNLSNIVYILNFQILGISPLLTTYVIFLLKILADLVRGFIEQFSFLFYSKIVLTFFAML